MADDCPPMLGAVLTIFGGNPANVEPICKAFLPMLFQGGDGRDDGAPGRQGGMDSAGGGDMGGVWQPFPGDENPGNGNDGADSPDMQPADGGSGGQSAAEFGGEGMPAGDTPDPGTFPGDEDIDIGSFSAPSKQAGGSDAVNNL